MLIYDQLALANNRRRCYTLLEYKFLSQVRILLFWRLFAKTKEPRNILSRHHPLDRSRQTSRIIRVSLFVLLLQPPSTADSLIRICQRFSFNILQILRRMLNSLRASSCQSKRLLEVINQRKFVADLCKGCCNNNIYSWAGSCAPVTEITVTAIRHSFVLSFADFSAIFKRFCFLLSRKLLDS